MIDVCGVIELSHPTVITGATVITLPLYIGLHYSPLLDNQLTGSGQGIVVI